MSDRYSENMRYYWGLAAEIEARESRKLFATPLPTKDAATPLPMQCDKLYCFNPAMFKAVDKDGRVVYYYIKTQFTYRKPICGECDDKARAAWNYDRDSSSN